MEEVRPVIVFRIQRRGETQSSAMGPKVGVTLGSGKLTSAHYIRCQPLRLKRRKRQSRQNFEDEDAVLTLSEGLQKEDGEVKVRYHTFSPHPSDLCCN